MKNKFLAGFAAFLLTAVLAAGWNCGCLFAAPPGPDIEVPHTSSVPEAGCSAHETHETSGKNAPPEHECCSGCQMTQGIQRPGSVWIQKVLASSAASNLFYPQAAKLISYAPDPNALFGSKSRQQLNLSAVQLPPVYLLIQVFRI